MTLVRLDPLKRSPSTQPLMPATEPGTGPGRGYVATQSVTGTKTDTPILETPQSISVVTRGQLDARNVQSLQALQSGQPTRAAWNDEVQSLLKEVEHV